MSPEARLTPVTKESIIKRTKTGGMIMPDKGLKRRRELLDTAREIIRKEGIGALSVRRLSEVSGASVGTVYLYFKSKKALIAAIVLEDWYKEIDRAKKHLEGKTQAFDRAKILYESFISFGAANFEIWAAYPSNLAEMLRNNDYHTYMINQIKEVFELDRFIIEVLLHYASLSDQSFGDISCQLKKLLGHGGDSGSCCKE